MKVAIDVTALLREATGVDNYLTSLVTHLSRIDRENQYTVFVNYGDQDRFHPLPENFKIIPLCFQTRSIRFIFQQLALPVAARALEVDVLHSPSFFMPFYRGSQRHLLTIHDMTFFSRPDCHTLFRRSWMFRSALLRSIRSAHLIAVPSGSSMEAVLSLVPDISPERIRVIPLGIGPEFRPYPPDQIQSRLAHLKLPQPYILHLGTIEPRKNLMRLVESYRQLVRNGEINEHLVLAGKWGWGCEQLLKQLDLPELRGKVHLAGYIPQSDLPFLYAGARLFVYPSLEEGFGFPPLEAMACGTPTIASLSSALTENLKGGAELVLPTDVEIWTATIRRMLSDESLRLEKREQGLKLAARFSWERTAKQTLECYKKLSEGKAAS